jgi:hypothetical protein
MKILRSIIVLLIFVATDTSLCIAKNIYQWLPDSASVETLSDQIRLPDGYERTNVVSGSFKDWLRHLPLFKNHPPVYLYDGEKKSNQNAHYAVVNIDVGKRDLQQCADAVIRLRAEYLYSIGDYDAIHFNFTSGDTASFKKWINGYRPVINNNHVIWNKSAEPDSSYESFRKYLEIVFTYAGSYSLNREMKKVENINQINIGDVFVQGGFPGHAIIVVDMAIDPDTKNRIFLLAQSYMPAQQIHILKNPSDSNLSPWYRSDFGNTLITPEWIFTKKDLKRFR